MKTNQDYANITLIIYKKGKYRSIEGEVGLKVYKPTIPKPVEYYIRFSDFLNNPGLVAKPGEAVKPYKITIKTKSGDQNIRLSDIVIATENKAYRWNQPDKILAIHSSLEKKPFSSSTKDGQYQIKGYVFNLKKQMKKNFIIIFISNVWVK